MDTYNSDLSFWIEWYTDCYEMGLFSFWDLRDKLSKLKSVESEWENHRNYKSYYNSVEALRIVIDRIDKEEPQ
jgi:hypothetical protein